MEKITRSVVIEAPASAAFEFLADPAHLPAIWPSMVETAQGEVLPDGGHRFDWTYQMAGLKFHGKARTVEVERDRLRVDRVEGGIPSTFRWRFGAQGIRSEVVLDVEYELPSIFGWLAAPFLRRLNEHEAETMLANLKARLEAPAAAKGA